MRECHHIHSAPFGADIYHLIRQVQTQDKQGVYIARDERQAQSAMALVQFFAPDLPALFLPAWDCLPYDRISPSPAVAAKRCAALSALVQYQAKAKGGAQLLITTSAAWIQKAPPRNIMQRAAFQVKMGQLVEQTALNDYLELNGYIRCSVVHSPGEYAIRGGIVDIFSPISDVPVRLDFFGDALDSLRSFDPETQRTLRQLTEINFPPVSEITFDESTQQRFRTGYLEQFGSPQNDMLYEAARSGIRRHGIEQWLPLFYGMLDPVSSYIDASAIISMDMQAIPSAKARWEQALDYYQARSEAGGDAKSARLLAPATLYMDETALNLDAHDGEIWQFSSLDAPPFEGSEDLGAKQGRNFAAERADPSLNLYRSVIEHIQALKAAGKTVTLAAWSKGAADRLINLLKDHDLLVGEPVYSLKAARQAMISVSELPVEAGIEMDDFAIIAEQDILGNKLARIGQKRKAEKVIIEAASLAIGDLIVHIEHGVGRYQGLKTLDVNGAPHDCLELVYSGGDKLFLPVENIELISRYGSQDSDTFLDKLGGASWQSRKARAKKRILEIASELIALAAKRAMAGGEPVTVGEGLYEEFSNRFAYAETEDQLSAIADVKSDLLSGKSMDRLVCGDVGFGKTEIALRAAFMVAMSGQQVAVIAPTTLLCRQHYETFRERFANLPVKIGQLSRMVTHSEANATREALKDGTCDIVIGTHALLSKMVGFKRLGMLVIDEEQRFGVKHKERLKALKANVHVLTLSATPIPRTLQMALTGIRELSIIATPPVDRLAVRTYVTEFDTVTVREALLRERYRGGQSFFVTPRVADLPKLETFLQEQVPEIRFITAHGQMSSGALEDAMEAFYDGKYDVLLSTTIVESGLDIPRANTLIIHRADRFGLAQLYQLRGRVGRSKLRAYAYMTTPRDQVLNQNAEKRLRILQSLDNLGAGFMLASQDLDMRGSGNLLGEQQSGNVREVGVELYQSMLEDAVRALRTGGAEVEDDWSPLINIGVAVLIPEQYVEALDLRLSLYRRLADLESEEDHQAFGAELIDRFGSLPDEVRQLLDVTYIKSICKRNGIAKLDVGPKGMVISFRDSALENPASLIQFVAAHADILRLRPDQKLVLAKSWKDDWARLKGIKDFLGNLEQAICMEAS